MYINVLLLSDKKGIKYCSSEWCPGTIDRCGLILTKVDINGVDKILETPLSVTPYIWKRLNYNLKNDHKVETTPQKLNIITAKKSFSKAVALFLARCT